MQCNVLFLKKNEKDEIFKALLNAVSERGKILIDFCLK